MFYIKSIIGFGLILMAQLSFAGGGPCVTVQSGNWSDDATWDCGALSAPDDNSPITIKSGHTVVLDVDTVGVGPLVVEAGGDFDVAASANGLNLNINTSTPSGDVDLSEAHIDLSGDFTINADNLDIKFGEVIGQFAVHLNSNSETRLLGKVGGDINNSPTAFVTDAAGTTVFDIPNGSLNSPNFIVYGNRIFNDDVLLAQRTHIKGSSGLLVFNGPINTDPSAGFQDLFFSFIDALQFNQNVGEVRKIGSIQMFNSANTVIEMNLSVISVVGQVVLPESIVLNSPTETVLITNTTVNASNFIGFGSTTGTYIRTASGANPNTLTFNLPASDVKLFAPIGDNNQPLSNLDINTTGEITLNTSVTTSANQNYTSNVLLGSDVILNAAQITVQNDIDTAGVDLTINNTDTINNSAVIGGISGSGNLLKAGAGLLEVHSNNTLSGNVTVEQGGISNQTTLTTVFPSVPLFELEQGSDSDLGSSDTTIFKLTNAQALIGEGSCSCFVQQTDGSVVSPGNLSGNFTGILSLDGLLMDVGSTLLMDINGTTAGSDYDQLVVNAIYLLTESGQQDLQITLGYVPNPGDTFTLVDNTGSGAVENTFFDLPEGSELTIDGYIFSISYVGGTGNDIVLTALSQPIVYVDQNSAPMGDGQSWATAFNTLQDALVAVVPDVRQQIWIAQGVYYPDEGGIQTDNDRNSTFTLIDGVSLYAGFAGTETDFNQRDVAANVTILSGDIDGNDIDIDGNFITENISDIRGGNSYRILSGENVDTTTTMDGLTITAGQADNNSIPRNTGAGIFCGVQEGPSINQVIFIGNKSSDRGAAMYGCANNVNQTSFIANNGGIAGAIYTFGGTIENSDFLSNTAIGAGGAIRNGNNILTIKNTTFMGNSSTSSKGGAVWTASDVNVENSLFSGNFSKTGGGAFYLQSTANAHLLNMTMTGNLTVGGSSNSKGAAIGGISSGALTIENSIIWNNKDFSGVGGVTASINHPNGTTLITNSLIQGSGGSGVNWVFDLNADGGNNLDQDPLFITDTDPSTAPTLLGDAHLIEVSIAIDAGDNGFVIPERKDLDGRERIVNTTVDMGAYEYFDEQVFKDGFE